MAGRLAVLWLINATACADDAAGPASRDAAADAQSEEDAAVSDRVDASDDGASQNWPFDAPCDGKPQLSGAAVVAAIGSPYADTLIYLDSFEMTPMQLTLTHEGGDVTCFPGVEPDQLARLEVIMVVTLRTDDGAFDETLEATVESFGSASTFTSREPLAEIEGTWAPEEASMFGPNPWLEISGNLFPTNTSGNVRLHGDAPTWAATAW
jgi:hypothetical protein